jgi:hypothetical protein
MAVYFIRAGEDGPVKIGSAEWPHHRVVSLQAGNAEKLRLIHQTDGWLAAERQVQQHYAHLQIRGEWFRFCPTMLVIETIINLDTSGAPKIGPKRRAELDARPSA